MTRNHLGASLIVLAAGLSAAEPAQALGHSDDRHIHPGPSGKVPLGWQQVCEAFPGECDGPRLEEKRVTLTTERMRELKEVNFTVNKVIEPMTDLEQYGEEEKWTFPIEGKGDCEDYVLEKRRILMQRGWPRQALLITVVLDPKSGGHAVLTVATDKGDFILDNQTDRVLPWSQTGLTFFRRQSAWHPSEWVELGRLVGRPDTLTATAQ
jgi:predicted transglutaminase-like cysteine proteinase